TDTATRVSSIAARALDFCPPVDIEFGDYLRALVTADYERAPDDPLGFRAAFIEGFRARGIYPASAWSMTEQALRWVPPADEHRIEDLIPDPKKAEDARHNAIRLRAFGASQRDLLGLDPTLPINVHRVHDRGTAATTSRKLDRS